MLQTDVLIIGAGIAGLTLGIGLKQREYDFLIMDKMPNIKGIGAGIGISSNAIEALKWIGMDEKIKAIANPLQSLMLLKQNGTPLLDGNPAIIKGYDLTNYALHRSLLHESLYQEIPIEKFLVPEQLVSIKKESNYFIVKTTTGLIIKCNYIIGADGLHSIVRQYFPIKNKITYAGYTCWRAIIDWPEELPKSSMETWGKNGRFGLTPLINNQLYWYACINTAHPKDPYFSNFTIENLRQNFENYHRNITLALTHTQNDQLIHNDISYLQPLDYYHFENMVLIGDAAHATTPNLGQGACMGIEDAIVLLQEMDRSKNNTTAAFANYSQRRVARCKKLVQTATALGKVAQWDNNLLIGLRNKLFPLMPKSLQAKQLKMVLDTQHLIP